MTNIADNIFRVRQSIADAEKSAGRPPGSVRLLAVSKTRPASDLLDAWTHAGQQAFGENYLQEALEKIETLKDYPLEWHFIGPIQSNKTRPIAEHFDWVHTVSREKVARRLNDQRPDFLPPLNVCIQVNISGEANKSGLRLEDVPALAHHISECPRLCLRGLMTIPAAHASGAELTDAFQRMRDAFEQLQNRHPQVDTLSMGMSGDLETAIRCGATLVRIGTAIFGPRPPKSH